MLSPRRRLGGCPAALAAACAAPAVCEAPRCGPAAFWYRAQALARLSGSLKSGALTTPLLLVGNNRSAKDLFRSSRRRAPPFKAGERSEGSDERSLVRAVRRAHLPSSAAIERRARAALPPSQRPRDSPRAAAAERCIAAVRRRRAEGLPPTIRWPAPPTTLLTGTNYKRGSPRKTRPSSWTKCGAPGRRTTSRRGDGPRRTTRPRRDISNNDTERSYFI